MNAPDAPPPSRVGPGGPDAPPLLPGSEADAPGSEPDASGSEAEVPGSATGEPGDRPGASYAELIARLAGAEAEHARRRTAVHEWFARQRARAEAEVARTAQRVAEAEGALSAAQAAVEFTEAESARLWQILAGRMRLRYPAQLGPPPAPDESGEPIAAHPAHLLDQVREALDQVRPVKRRRKVGLPLLIVAVLVVLAGIGVAAFKLAS